MVNRIQQIIEKKKLTAAQFAGEVGVQRSAVSHLLSGRNKPSLDFVLKIKKRFPELNLDWLLLGEGEMMEDSAKKEIPVKNRQGEFFRNESSFEGTEENADEPAMGKMKVPVQMAKSEDVPYYRTESAKKDQAPQRVVLLYPDDTFKIFEAR